MDFIARNVIIEIDQTNKFYLVLPLNTESISSFSIRPQTYKEPTANIVQKPKSASLINSKTIHFCGFLYMLPTCAMGILQDLKQTLFLRYLRNYFLLGRHLS